MTENQDTPAQETPQQQVAATAPAPTWHTWMAAAAGVLALVAWIVVSFNGYAALAVGAAAFAAGCLGLHAHTRGWRNLAITALVASAVVLVVVSAFLIVIFWGLNSI